MKEKTMRISGLILTIIICFVFLASFVFRESIIEVMSAEAQAAGLLMILILSVLLEFIPQYVAPHYLIISASIIGFNWYLIILSVSVGGILGGLLGFEVGRVYGSSVMHSILGIKKIIIVERWIKKYGPGFIFLATILPLPYIPIVFGSLSMPRKRFILFGIIPRTISYLAIAIGIKFLGF